MVSPGGLRAAERALRDAIRHEVTGLLDARGTLVLGRDDEARIRALIAERGAAHQRRAVGTNTPPLPNPGGTVFAARRQAQNTADVAARAGAQEIDIGRYRDSGEVVLDRAMAHFVVRQYIEGLDGFEATVETSGTQVIVTVRRDVALSFLNLVGMRPMRACGAGCGPARLPPQAARRRAGRAGPRAGRAPLACDPQGGTISGGTLRRSTGRRLAACSAAAARP